MHLGQHDVATVSDKTRMSRWLHEGQRQREGHPAEQREQQDCFPLSPALGDVAPEWTCDQLDERPKADEHASLGWVHTKLLEVDTNQGKERPEGGKKEEIEGLWDEQIVVNVCEVAVDVFFGTGRQTIFT